MKEGKTPYKAHLFVCTKTRDTDRKSCGDGNAVKLAKNLKNEVNLLGLKGTVRVSTTGCLGLCEEGPNIFIHPQGIWLSDVRPSDLPDIMNMLKSITSDNTGNK